MTTTISTPDTVDTQQNLSLPTSVRSTEQTTFFVVINVPSTDNITPEDIVVSPRSITISKGDQIKWICNAPEPFSCAFSNPFADSVVIYGKDGESEPQPFHFEGTFNYVVTYEGISVDPIIIVDGTGGKRKP